MPRNTAVSARVVGLTGERQMPDGRGKTGRCGGAAESFGLHALYSGAVHSRGARVGWMAGKSATSAPEQQRGSHKGGRLRMLVEGQQSGQVQTEKNVDKEAGWKIQTVTRGAAPKAQVRLEARDGASCTMVERRVAWQVRQATHFKVSTGFQGACV